MSKKRRSFLKSAAALLPAAGFNPMSIAGAQVQGLEHVIAAGQDRSGEARSRGYSSILSKVLPRETSNGLFVLEHIKLERRASTAYASSSGGVCPPDSARCGLRWEINDWC